MTKTKYYDLQMDDPQDDYDVEVVNANLKKIDEQMKIRENATDALQEPEFTVADKRENIASKEKISKILGKIAKFFADLKAVAFTGNYNDLSDKPTSLPANGGNSDTVNSHTVESNVPKNAKFTDTTYSDATTTTHGLMSATDKKLLDVLNKPLATCATGRATAAKVATLQNFTLQVGSTVVVKFTGTGTANPTSGNLTLNVNGTGARIMGYFRNGNKAAISYVSGNFFCSNATHIFTYDGTYWLCMDWNLDNNTTYSNFVKSGTGAKAGLVPAPSTTAGTTKYLREDGAWKTPPDTKTSVVNNNTTTEPGSALDARQANPNIEGTMAASIAQLNSNLENYITARQGYFGTSGVSSSWIQASDCPQKYQYAYKFPDVDGYKFLIGFTNIRWTNSDKYYDYMLRNYILNTQSDKVEMYSGQGTPDCIMYFFGLYIKS